MQLDETDQKILRLIQLDATLPLEEIARQIGRPNRRSGTASKSSRQPGSSTAKSQSSTPTKSG